MLKYKLPAIKKKKAQKEIESLAIDPMEDVWMRQVRVPVSKEIITALEVGEDVKLTLIGTIRELRSEDRERGSMAALEIEVSEVHAPSKNEYEKLDEGMDDEEEDEG